MTNFAATLADLKAQHLYRDVTEYAPLDGGHVLWRGRRCVLMASNNYLNLTHHPQVQQAAVEAVRQYGTGAGGSRLTTGSHPLYAALEQAVADFKGAAAALVFNTGYMANVGTVSALVGPGDTVFSDELNHASIIDGCRLSRAKVVVYKHAAADDLAAKLAAVNAGRKLVVTDGVFSMDGDIAPLADIVAVARRHHALVMVDDAHATGVVGEGGRGTAAYAGVAGQVDVQVGTLSKALAAEGGFVAGSRDLIAYLRNRARSFIFSTALAPATIGAALAALGVLRRTLSLPAQLRESAAYFRAGLTAAGFHVPPGITPIVPVLVGDAALTMALACRLGEAGVIVSGIRPPAVPAGTSRLRITVTAAHTRQDLDQALAALTAAGRELGLI